MNRAEFGVGCLTFVPVRMKPEAGEESSGNRDALWKKAVEGGLALLPSVTNLAVEIGGLYYRMPSRMDPLVGTEFDVFDESPLPGSYVGFSITIPKRMHKELAPFIMGPKFECEQFQVVTVYGKNGPATFIRCLEDSGLESAGSMSIILVREFVNRELRRLNAPIELKTVGPSPFWANFELTPVEADEKEQARDLHWERRESSYDDVYAFYDPATESIDNAYAQVVNNLKDGFSLYYEAVRGRNKRKLRSDMVLGMADDLIAAHGRGGIRGWFVKTFTSGNLARDLSITALRAKQVEAHELSARDDTARHTQLPDVLAKRIADESVKSFRDELEMSIETAKLLEGGRLKQYEVFVLAAATAFGAIAGAIAALIAS